MYAITFGAKTYMNSMSNPKHSARCILSIIALVMLGAGAKAQDLIVTMERDSMNVRITKIGQGYFDYNKAINGGTVAVRIASRDVLYFERGFYDPLARSLPVKSFAEPFPKFRLGVQSGYSYLVSRIDNVPEAMKPHVEKLRHGYNIGADFAFFPRRSIGFGLMYRHYRTASSTDNVYMVNTFTGRIGFGTLEDDIIVHFVGPSFNTRFYTRNRKAIFNIDVALGFVDYTNYAVVVDPIKISTITYGFHYGIGADIAVSRDFTVGLGIALALAPISYYDYNFGSGSRTVNLGSKSQESLSRFELSVAVRWHK